MTTTIRPGQVYWHAGKSAWAVVWEVGDFGAAKLWRLLPWAPMAPLRRLSWNGSVPAGWMLVTEAP